MADLFPAILPGTRPVGYAHLVHRHGLIVVPHHRWSYIGGIRRELRDSGISFHEYPSGYAPSDWDSDVEHLLFSLKYDGVNLEILAACCHTLKDAGERETLAAKIRSLPTGKYVRRLWLVYEELTGDRLPVDDLSRGNYVPLLEASEYVTGPEIRSRRQRVDINLLGNWQFCPMVRRSPTLEAADATAISARITQIVGQYDTQVIARAISYLYTKETMSSFAIENERPKQGRADRFMAMLRRLPEPAALSAAALIDVQNAIVDPRFAESGFRSSQVYVGESLDLVRQYVHFMAPRPEDVPQLMEGLLKMARDTAKANVDPVVLAAALAFGFVFIHPFEDGNGRIHRFLIHYILAREGFGSPNLLVPVSVVMLANRTEYDACLESFSKPLMERLNYALAADGTATVTGETLNHYRFFDATRMAEDLYVWLNAAVEGDLVSELEFLTAFRAAADQIQELVDLPDRLLHLFIKLCHQNGGTLSDRKRKKHFAMLTADELEDMQEAVRDAFDMP